MKRTAILLITLLLLLAAAGCATTGDTNDAPAPTGNSAGEPGPEANTGEAQIYAAAIRQIYTVDHSFGESPGWSQVYVVTTTDDSAMIDAPKAPPQVLPADLQQGIAAELGDLPFELIWVDSAFEAPTDPADGSVAGGDGIIISLGNIHPQDDGSVQLPFFMTCGGLCGIGKTYVLAQAGDAWQVTGSVGPEIMS
jgi:hypothetical protein